MFMRCLGTREHTVLYGFVNANNFSNMDGFSHADLWIDVKIVMLRNTMNFDKQIYLSQSFALKMDGSTKIPTFTFSSC